MGSRGSREAGRGEVGPGSWCESAVRAVRGGPSDAPFTLPEVAGSEGTAGDPQRAGRQDATERFPRPTSPRLPRTSSPYGCQSETPLASPQGAQAARATHSPQADQSTNTPIITISNRRIEPESVDGIEWHPGPTVSPSIGGVLGSRRQPSPPLADCGQTVPPTRRSSDGTAAMCGERFRPIPATLPCGLAGG